ncbi:hypothetical protein EW146_g3441, partial [Bondarzewia mesenterica]
PVVLVPGSPEPASRDGGGVDLRSVFRDRGREEGSDDIEVEDNADGPPRCSFGSAATTTTDTTASGPETPVNGEEILVDVEEIDVEEAVLEGGRVRQAVVAQGWWAKWACDRGGMQNPKPAVVMRDGGHQAHRFRPQSAPSKSTTARAKYREGHVQAAIGQEMMAVRTCEEVAALKTACTSYIYVRAS